MKETLVAVYERQSTLWRNANGFYRSQDWTRMECKVYDYTDDIASIMENGVRWLIREDGKDVDVTESEIEKRYGKPYYITFYTKSRMNSKSYSFKTKEEANEFVKSVLADKILGNFKRIQ